MQPTNLTPPTLGDYIFMASGLLGGIAHWMKKFADGETTATLTEWYGRAHMPSTIYTVLFFCYTMTQFLATNSTDSMSLYTVLATGFSVGYTIDSMVNKDGSKLPGKVGTNG